MHDFGAHDASVCVFSVSCVSYFVLDVASFMLHSVLNWLHSNV